MDGLYTLPHPSYVFTHTDIFLLQAKRKMGRVGGKIGKQK